MPLSLPLKHRWFRRASDVESQTCDSLPTLARDEKATSPLDEAPPAYAFPAEKGRPSLALSIPPQPALEPDVQLSPIVQTTHDNMPTIMVLVKEDYAWARSYLKEFNYRRAARRMAARHLYSASIPPPNPPPPPPPPISPTPH
jgi:hypothetical protein